MKYTKWLMVLFIITGAFGLYSCKDKRHDRSREYRLDHYAFVLVSAISDREFYLKILRDILQEKRKTIVEPDRADTLKGDGLYLASYDSLFFGADELLYEPIRKAGSAAMDNTPPDNFTAEEAAWLNAQTGRLISVFRRISGTYQQFDQYYKRGDYRKDSGAYGIALIDSIRLLDGQFGVISDSIILGSDRMFKDIYQVPERKDTIVAAAALMERSVKACEKYILLLQPSLSGKEQPDVALDKIIKTAKDSISHHQMTLLGLSGTERSIWTDVLVLKFRGLLFKFITYIEVRLPGPGQKERIQAVDLDFLRDLENRMQNCLNVFLRL